MGKRIEIVVLVRIGQRCHGFIQAKGNQGIDFAGGASEACTVQKMRGRRAVPESFREGGKHLPHLTPFGMIGCGLFHLQSKGFAFAGGPGEF